MAIEHHRKNTQYERKIILDIKTASKKASNAKEMLASFNNYGSASIRFPVS